MSDFTGKTEKIPCEHSYMLINELEAFKTLIFDTAEVRTLKALVKDHESLTARLAEAERKLGVYKKAVEHYAEETNWVESPLSGAYYYHTSGKSVGYEVAQVALKEGESR